MVTSLIIRRCNSGIAVSVFSVYLCLIPRFPMTRSSVSHRMSAWIWLSLPLLEIFLPFENHMNKCSTLYGPKETVQTEAAKRTSPPGFRQLYVTVLSAVTHSHSFAHSHLQEENIV